MDDALRFRNIMAERGYEFTPDHARRVLKYLAAFRQSIHDKARSDPAEIERLSSLTVEEKQGLRKELAAAGEPVTMKQLDELIELVLMVYDEEKM